MHYNRETLDTLKSRLQENRRFIQVISGPRQVGKTTLVKQLISDIEIPSHYASADLPTIKDTTWLEQQWSMARSKLNEHNLGIVLILDEIQKIPNWSEHIKKYWDDDTFHDRCIYLIILGSAPLLLQQGLSDSLAGRFELNLMTHWSFAEMQAAFDWGLEEYIVYGGYPGSADLITEPQRWADYIQHTLIETTISRDILLMARVDKPALLRQLFFLGCNYSGQILSYQKMLGQLADAGNASTLAHYLKLLSGAGMILGIEKYSGSVIRQKASSPKLQVFNTALITAQSRLDISDYQNDLTLRGRLVESAVGAYFANESLKGHFKLYYWRERQYEVDFVIEYKNNIFAFEVKSGLKKTGAAGFKHFQSKFNPKKILLIGGDGIPLADFFSKPILFWLD